MVLGDGADPAGIPYGPFRHHCARLHTRWTRRRRPSGTAFRHSMCLSRLPRRSTRCIHRTVVYGLGRGQREDLSHCHALSSLFRDVDHGAWMNACRPFHPPGGIGSWEICRHPTFFYLRLHWCPYSFCAVVCTLKDDQTTYWQKADRACRQTHCIIPEGYSVSTKDKTFRNLSRSIPIVDSPLLLLGVARSHRSSR